MATYLFRLGRLCFRRRRPVLLIWVFLLAVVGIGAATADSPADEPFSVPGIEAQRAVDLLNERNPDAAADGATARIVFRSENGRLDTGPAREGVEAAMGQVRGGAEVASVADPFSPATMSDDGRTAFAVVDYTGQADALSGATTDALKAAADSGRAAGLTVELGGDALGEEPHGASSEIIGLILAAVVLAVTFGALVAAGLPLVTAVIGVLTTIGAITALASPLGLGSNSSTLALMIGLAVGIDYALFVVSRYRSELRRGRTPEDAAAYATGTAGSAVTFAGLTVVIALVGLAVAGVPMLTELGMAAAAAVVVAVLVALTLLPALLGFAGPKIFGRKERRATAEDRTRASTRTPFGGRWARFVLRRPVAVLLICVAGLGALAIPVADMQLGLPDDGVKGTDTTQRRAYDLLTDGFGPGFNGPMLVVVDTAGAADPQAAVDGVTQALTRPGVASVSEAALTPSGDTATISVVPASRPAAAETEELLHDIRADLAAVDGRTGATSLVGGTTALNIDFSEKLDDALLPYVALVVGLAFLLLIVVFRSILVPLKAALGFLLSVLASLGAVVAVFQWGWLGGLIGVEQTGPIMSVMPIFLVGVVFGLAMDYEVFLVSGMREAWAHGSSPRESIVVGMRDNARVVTAAALIMIGVFAGFVGSSEPMIKMIGFGLAAAVALDAFVVRMALVPAVLALMGRAAWWLPRRLDKVMPDVDIEGAKLAGHHLGAHDDAQPKQPQPELVGPGPV